MRSDVLQLSWLFRRYGLPSLVLGPKKHPNTQKKFTTGILVDLLFCRRNSDDCPLLLMLVILLCTRLFPCDKEKSMTSHFFALIFILYLLHQPCTYDNVFCNRFVASLRSVAVSVRKMSSA